MSESTKAVFLSYASQDAESAKRICEALRATGVEVWFDQNELVGGDAWDQKIRGQIASCALFVPIISANTQARLEGYFRREWKQAAARTHDMADEKAFLLPVVIDDTRDAEAKVPAEFKAVQWTRLPVRRAQGPEPAEGRPAGSGAASPPAEDPSLAKFCARVQALLEGEAVWRGLRTPPSANEAGFGDPALQRSSLGRLWWVLPIFGVTMALVLVLKERREPSPSTAAPGGNTPADAQASPHLPLPPPTSEARRLAVKAHENFTGKVQTAERFRAAMELAERATTLDPLDGEVWALSALADLSGYENGLDSGEKRRDQIWAKVAKAKGLAPASVWTRYAEAKAFIRAEGSAEGLAAGVELLRGLPACSDVQGMLGIALHRQGKYDEGGRLLESVGWYNAAGWAYLEGGNPERAQVMAERQMGTDPVNGAVQWFCVALAHADLPGMQAVLERIPLAARMDEQAVGARIWLADFQRDAAALLRAARMLPAEFKGNNFVYAPRGYFVGVAQRRLGNEEAARAEWTTTLQQVETLLAGHADDTGLQFNRLFLLAKLGRTEEAERDLRVLRQRHTEGWQLPTAQLLATLGRRDEAMEVLARMLRPSEPGLWFFHADARFNPVYDSLRGDPRFEKLLRERRPKYAKPFDDEKGEAKP